MDDLRGTPMSVGTLEEIIDDNHAIVSTSVGSEHYVSILSFVDKDLLEPGCSVLLNHKVRRCAGRFPSGCPCPVEPAPEHGRGQGGFHGCHPSADRGGVPRDPAVKVPASSQVHAVIGVLMDDTDPLVTVMKVEKAPQETYADIGGLDNQIQEIKVRLGARPGRASLLTATS